MEETGAAADFEFAGDLAIRGCLLAVHHRNVASEILCKTLHGVYKIAVEARLSEAARNQSYREKIDVCITTPKAVAVRPMTAVTVNGIEILVSPGGTVFQAIRNSGQAQPLSVLPKLAIYKSWKGRLIRIRFSRGDAAILKLLLQGGEVISWK